MGDKRRLAITSRGFSVAFAAIVGLVGAVFPAEGSQPDRSSGCQGRTLSPPARDITQATWRISQTTINVPDPQTIGRTFNVHVPPQSGVERPLPIVINLHGANGNGSDHDRDTRMREKGDSEGFVVVTPDAWPWRQWTKFAAEVGQRQGISDVEFIRMLLDIVTRELCIDRNRIFATGGSDGGVMSATLARAGAEGRLGAHKIAAVATVVSTPVPPEFAAPAWEWDPNDPNSNSGGGSSQLRTPPDQSIRTWQDPVPMHVFFSNEDRVIANGACYATYFPILKDATAQLAQRFFRPLICVCIGSSPCSESFRSGIKGNLEFSLEVAQRAVDYWARKNGCAANLGEPVPTGNSDWGVRVASVTFNCTAVPQSRGDTIFTIFNTSHHPDHPNKAEDPNGHIWPGGVNNDSSFKVTDAIWDFFESHPR